MLHTYKRLLHKHSCLSGAFLFGNNFVMNEKVILTTFFIFSIYYDVLFYIRFHLFYSLSNLKPQARECTYFPRCERSEWTAPPQREPVRGAFFGELFVEGLFVGRLKP